MMGRWDYGYGTGGSVIATLAAACIGAIILAGLIILMIYLVRSASGHGGGHRGYGHGEHHGQGQGQGTGYDFLGPRGGQSDEALEIARRRFAAGEITREQYDDIVATLNR